MPTHQRWMSAQSGSSSALARARADDPVTLEEGGAPARRRARMIDDALAGLAGDILTAGPDQNSEGGRKASGGKRPARGPATGSGLAVVAVGGYGRGELSPRSDLDLLVLAGSDEPDKEQLQALLYPLWDAGMQVGHAVRTPVEAIEHAARDLDAATALLTARLVAGDAEAFHALVALRSRWLETGARTLVQQILGRTAERHARAQRAGWVLAPDLKQDAGGLRDLHALVWLEAVVAATTPDHQPSDHRAELDAAGETLLAVREALHGLTGRAKDRVRIDLQPALARRLGLTDAGGADTLMASVHVAARTIEHRAALELRRLAERVLGGPRRSGRVVNLGHGLRVADGVLIGGSGEGGSGKADELTLALRLLAARAKTGRPIAPKLHAWLERCFDRPAPARWDRGVLTAFLEMLRARDARAACELLDHVGGWTVLLPEWSGVRGLAQYDHFHTATVDGHLFGAVTEVARLTSEHPVAREAAAAAGDLDNLYVAALLHDVGKGTGEDHSVSGERLARGATERMGLSPADVEEVGCLVREHLLLALTATRRDLDDPAVIRMVAERLREPRRLRLLYVLTLADAHATGPGAWSGWKDALVLELYRKTLRALDPNLALGEGAGGGHAVAVRTRALEVAAAEPELTGHAAALLGGFPPSYLRSASVADTADELTLVRQALADRDATADGAAAQEPDQRSAARPSGQIRYRLDTEPVRGHPAVTVCAPEGRGTLARAAGVLALHRISVLRAQAYATTYGLALVRLVVDPPPEPAWDRVAADLEAAHDGRVAVEARLERKVRGYQQGAFPPPEVAVLPDASEAYTVVEVRARDALGLLYAITAALGDLQLDVHVAKIDTLGDEVVDVFYVRTATGEKLTAAHAAEVQLAIRHRTTRLLSATG